MIEKFKKWLRDRLAEDDPPPPPTFRRSSAATAKPRRRATDKTASDMVEIEPDSETKLSGNIGSAGPGKNVLMRHKYIREDTGTHETLKILDDSLIDTGEEPGIDPYNTGGFDRSKNWNKRFGK